MSSSITRVGGMVVVTQVVPQSGVSISLQVPTDRPQAPPPVHQAPPTPPTKGEDVSATYLRMQPHALGVVQIFIGVLSVLFSLSSAFSPMLILFCPFSLGVVFVLSGSLTAAAANWTLIKLVWASLVSNTISVTVGVGGVAYLCWVLGTRPLSSMACDLGDAQQREMCVSELWVLDVCGTGLLSLLLILLVLQVSVAVTVFLFSIRTIRRHRCHAPLNVSDRERLLSEPGADIPTQHQDDSTSSTSTTSSGVTSS